MSTDLRIYRFVCLYIWVSIDLPACLDLCVCVSMDLYDNGVFFIDNYPKEIVFQITIPVSH